MDILFYVLGYFVLAIIGGAAIRIGKDFSLEGMALASIVGVVLNLILPGRESVSFEKMFKD